MVIQCIRTHTCACAHTHTYIQYIHAYNQVYLHPCLSYILGRGTHSTRGSLGTAVKLLPCSSPQNSHLENCRKGLRTKDPKWSDPSLDPAQAGAMCTGLPFFYMYAQYVAYKNTFGSIYTTFQVVYVPFLQYQHKCPCVATGEKIDAWLVLVRFNKRENWAIIKLRIIYANIKHMFHMKKTPVHENVHQRSTIISKWFIKNSKQRTMIKQWNPRIPMRLELLVVPQLASLSNFSIETLFFITYDLLEVYFSLK